MGWHNNQVSCLQKQQCQNEEVCDYNVTWPRQLLQGKSHLGEGAPPAAKEGDQEETEDSQKTQEYGQTKLSEGGWYFSSDQLA